MLGQSLFMTNYWIVTVHYQNYIIRHTLLARANLDLQKQDLCINIGNYFKAHQTLCYFQV